ncbi:hypothetical protein [Anabaena sp. UHCC 0451]|uniref:hypothetical protein n=1 Tax=Anabaena sp. UHCC 0451 TaxID=2055235 RepID=UPI002B216631|nr:hypothetical protein [Anabaena sp. UHCC 0451]MEA5578650.1 hypothetical protein [Anabaena sp. UHCC 0451]
MRYLTLLFPEGSKQCLLWGRYPTIERAEQSCKGWLELEPNGRTITLPIQDNSIFGSYKGIASKNSEFNGGK